MASKGPSSEEEMAGEEMALVLTEELASENPSRA